MDIRSIGTILPAGERRGNKAQARVQSAYAALFAGNGTQEDAELVLSDLANVTGFYRYTGPEATDAELRFYEGQKSVFARIIRFLAMPPEQLRAMEIASAREAHAEAMEGPL